MEKPGVSTEGVKSIRSMAVLYTVRTVSLLSFVLALSMLTFWMLSRPGQPFATGRWAHSFLGEGGPTWGVMALSSLGAMAFTWFFLKKPSNTLYYFLMFLVGLTLFNGFNITSILSPMISGALSIGVVAIFDGVMTYRGIMKAPFENGKEISAESGDKFMYDPESEHNKAIAFIDAEEYEKANDQLGQMLINSRAYTSSQEKEIKAWKVLCLGKLGKLEEGRSLLKQDRWMDEWMARIALQGYKKLSGLPEVRSMEGMEAHTNAEISQETIALIRKNADIITTFDTVYRFDANVASNFYYHLAWQAQFARLYVDAAKLLFLGLEERPGIGSKFEEFKVYKGKLDLLNLLGDIYLNAGQVRDALSAYDRSLKLDSWQPGIKDRRNKMFKESQGTK